MNHEQAEKSAQIVLNNNVASLKWVVVEADVLRALLDGYTEAVKELCYLCLMMPDHKADCTGCKWDDRNGPAPGRENP